MRMLEQVAKLIGDEIGADKVLTSYSDMYVYEFDATPMFRGKPDLVVRAFSIDDVVAVMRIANERKIPVVPRGHASSLTGAAVPSQGGIVLDLSAMRKIEVHPEDGYVKAEAGATVAEVDLACNEFGFFLPPDPASADTATIGASIAENAGGMRGARYGSFRNWVLGMTVVLPGGKVFKLGAPVFKQRMGYDLMQLFIGSEGTLGVITDATLKIIPQREGLVRFFSYFRNIREVVDVIQDLKRSKIDPLVVEFMDEETLKCVNEAYKTNFRTDGIALMIDIDGYQEQLDAVADRAEEIIRKHNPLELDKARGGEPKAIELYTARKASYPAISRLNKIVLIEDLTVPLSKVPDAFSEAKSIGRKYGISIPTFGHIGDGNFHPTITFRELTKENLELAKKIFEEVSDVAIKYGGVVSGEHGIGLQKKASFVRMLESMGSSELIEYMKRVKELFDPNGIMNPGKVF